jgi:molybdenum cofactor synthesis domain-containing protein
MATCNSAEIRTAGLIIIGNEILSGKVQDANSYFLARELRMLGVSLMRISVISDDVDGIGSEARDFSERFDHVFTSGGVGPTHDDMTMAGIAKGFGVNLVRNELLEKKFRARYGDAMNQAVLKMAEIPEGAEVIELGSNSFPLVVFRNIYIFPGIPKYLQEKFSLIKERFRTAGFYLKRFFLRANESDIAAILNTVAEENICVVFGSYPVLGNPDFQIILTAESKSEGELNKAVDDLLGKLPREILVSIE